MKRLLILFMTIIFFVLIGQAAWAAGPAPEITKIKVDGTEVEEGETYTTRNNLVNIDVECTDAASVKVNAYSLKKSSVTDSVYSIDDFPLKPGLNKLTVQATGSGTAKKLLNINYIASFAQGTEYISELPATGTISVFEKSVNLKFSKNSFIMDDKKKIISNQKLIFDVMKDLEPDEYPSKFYVPVSNIVRIRADDSPEADAISSPGTITIKFQDTVPDFTAETITVMYRSGSGWKNIGALVDAKNKTATAPFQGFGRYGVFNASRYFDDYDNWAKPYAEPLWAKGVMQLRNSRHRIVTEDFDDDPVDELGLKVDCVRVDFASMMVRAMGYTPVKEPGSDSRFSDMDDDDILEDDRIDVETAVAYGIVEGIGVDKFAPHDSLTRAQAAVIIARVMKLSLNSDEDKVDKELGKFFKNTDDLERIPEWSKPHVLACVKAKYINGTTSENGIIFDAQKPLTRGEAAKLVYLVMKAKKLI